MRRYITILVICAIIFIVVGLLVFNDSKNSPLSHLETIKVLEDRRSIINLPMYLALEKGYFQDNNLNIELSTAKDGELPMGILDEGKKYHLLLCEGEEMIYAWQAENKKYKYIYNLAQGSGTYLLSRSYSSNFQPEMLDRKLLIGAPRGTLKEMILEYYLHTIQLSPQRDVNIAQTLIPPHNTKVFLNNSGDFLLTEEPNATFLVGKGLGAVQVNLSNITFPLLNKGLITTPEMLRNNSRLLQGLINALYQAQLTLNSQEISEFLPLIKKYFPNNTNAELITAITNYKKLKVWPVNPLPNSQQFNNLTKLMDSAGELRKPLMAKDFLESSLVNNSIKEIKKEE